MKLPGEARISGPPRSPRAGGRESKWPKPPESQKAQPAGVGLQGIPQRLRSKTSRSGRKIYEGYTRESGKGYRQTRLERNTPVLSPRQTKDLCSASRSEALPTVRVKSRFRD